MDSEPPSPTFRNIGALSHSPEQLADAEKRWVGYQPYLLSKGYQLRPRYRPDWIPSWTIHGGNPMLCEDGWDSLPIRTLDALRLKDQRWVVIKMILPAGKNKEGLHELEIIKRFSSEKLGGDESNHVVPCLESFEIPDVEGGIFYVMPLLTPYDRPAFTNLNEIHEFLRQVFEGLVFMHAHDVAHCDIAGPNIMMDARPLYHEQFHPASPEFSLDGTRILETRTRTEAPVRYYYIDFGYSAWNRDADANFLIRGRQAREPAPEQMEGQPYDPFVADVYQLGALLRRDLIPYIPSLRFIIPLARAMSDKDPKKRLSLVQAQGSMHRAFAARGARSLRWPLIPKGVGITQWIAYTAVGIRNEIILLYDAILHLCRRFQRSVFGL